MFERHELDALVETDQIFTVHHRSEDKFYFINVGLLHRLRKAAPHTFKLIRLDISEELYNFYMAQRGIEEDHIARMKGAQLREPGMAIFDEAGDMTMIDGHHRAVRRYRGNLKWLNVWVTVPMVWRQALVDAPEGSLMRAFLMQGVPVSDPNLSDKIQTTARWQK